MKKKEVINHVSGHVIHNHVITHVAIHVSYHVINFDPRCGHTHNFPLNILI